MNWIQPFDIDFSLYEDLTGSTSAADFARTLTNADERSFSALTPQQIMAKLLTKWESLSIEVWECCTALPDMIPYIQDCVQVRVDISLTEPNRRQLWLTELFLGPPCHSELPLVLRPH